MSFRDQEDMLLLRRSAAALRLEDVLTGSPLFPTEADLSADRVVPSISPNRDRGPYENGDSYLRTHVNLLREDFIRSVNEQINQFKVTGKETERIYNVILGDSDLNWKQARGTVTTALKVHFLETERIRRIKWDEEKRLLNGSLVFFSADNFATLKVGVVKRTPPNLIVELICGARSQNGGFIRDARMSVGVFGEQTMMECEAFYFPYLHVTEGLKEIDKIPFEEEIVRANPLNPQPDYLKQLYGSKAALDAQVREYDDILDESQLQAMKSVLSHRVGLVQGPPGTGKTHLGCQIVNFLLSLKKAGLISGPLLMVTTTKHAVDTFLRKCLDFTKKVLHASGQGSRKRNKQTYGELQTMYDEVRTPNDQKHYMRQADLIAVTTSRAAFIRNILRDLDIKIVLVEEAAEAMEAHVVASIPPTAQHLILLGDHKQLRPGTACKSLAEDYLLDISLLERLKDNGFTCPMLLQQRRMKPEIRELIAGIYPGLTDHPEDTFNRPSVTGMGSSVFFLTHEHKEAQEWPNPSYYNDFEASMVVALTRHLLNSGHRPESITVLSTYKKQESIIQERMSPVSGKVLVTTVDNFQGEENDIVILSLVRNNDDASVGFMKRENRACVALSRARNGLYILGSLRTIHASQAPVWIGVLKALLLSKPQRIGKDIPLTCCRHRTPFKASNDAEMRRGCVLCRL